MWYICKSSIYIFYCFACLNHILFEVFVFIKDFNLSYVLQIINSFMEMLRHRGNIWALILLNEYYIHYFAVFCYINQIEISGFVFSNLICCTSFIALRAGFLVFSLSFIPAFSYWLQRLQQETCFESPDIRAAKQKKKCKWTWSSSSSNCLISASLLCWVTYLLGTLSLLPFLNSTSHWNRWHLVIDFIMVLQMFVVFSLWIQHCATCYGLLRLTVRTLRSLQFFWGTVYRCFFSISPFHAQIAAAVSQVVFCLQS